MQRLLHYLTHPQVIQDPNIPVQNWHLSGQGRQRLESCNWSALFAQSPTIVSSTETKAVETAEIVASSLATDFAVHDDMHENDRSATGYLPPDRFEQTADQFFALPEESIDGWERAIDAQTRIIAQVEAVLSNKPEGKVLLTGHGAVGTLLFCHFAGYAISRSHDQPTGGGNLFTVNPATGDIVHPWMPIESL